MRLLNLLNNSNPICPYKRFLSLNTYNIAMISYVDKGVLVSKSGADECRGNRTDIKDRYEQEGDNEMEFSNSQWFYVPDHVSCVHVLVYSERNTVM